MLNFLIFLSFGGLLAAFVMVLVRPAVAENQGPSWDRDRVQPRKPLGGGWITASIIALVAAVALASGAPLLLALAVTLLIGVAVHVLVQTLQSKRDVAFELALASALDLVTASLRSGAALLDSLESAAAEAPGRVAPMLNGLFARLRLGEGSATVLEDTAHEYPYEGVRLFTLTLGAHLESGGSAATSMAEIAKAIRDRVDVVRRTSTQAAETQASVIGIMAITYGLAYLTWSQYPDRVEDFVSTQLGVAFISASIFMQAMGIAWIWSMVKVEI